MVYQCLLPAGVLLLLIPATACSPEITLPPHTASTSTQWPNPNSLTLPVRWGVTLCPARGQAGGGSQQLGSSSPGNGCPSLFGSASKGRSEARLTHCQTKGDIWPQSRLPATTEVHPQMGHILIGLERRCFLCSEATEKWLTGGLTCKHKLWPSWQDRLCVTHLLQPVFVQCKTCLRSPAQPSAYPLWTRTHRYARSSLRQHHINKKNQKRACFLLQWSVTATERLCVFPPTHTPFLHQEVSAPCRLLPAPPNAGSACTAPHFIHGPSPWLPHFKLVKLLDPSASFLPAPLFIPSTCSSDTSLGFGVHYTPPVSNFQIKWVGQICRFQSSQSSFHNPPWLEQFLLSWRRVLPLQRFLTSHLFPSHLQHAEQPRSKQIHLHQWPACARKITHLSLPSLSCIFIHFLPKKGIFPSRPLLFFGKETCWRFLGNSHDKNLGCISQVTVFVCLLIFPKSSKKCFPFKEPSWHSAGISHSSRCLAMLVSIVISTDLVWIFDSLLEMLFHLSFCF